MSITHSIDSAVYDIRYAVQSIRDSIDSDEIDSELDDIESKCDELSSLEEEDPDDILDDVMTDMGLGGLLSHWGHIDAGTADELRDTVTRILKEHGYNVG